MTRPVTSSAAETGSSPVTAADPVRQLDHESAIAEVAKVAASSSGHVGLAALHLETGEQISWNPETSFNTASTIKVAIYAEVMRQVRTGRVDLSAPVTTAERDLVGGSGVLSILRPGLRCTVADLCTLMIVISDNTATNVLIDLLGGVSAVNAGVTSLGYPGLRLNHKIGYAPPPLVVPDAPPAPSFSEPLGIATPAEFCRLLADLHAGTVVDAAASAEMISVLRHQQSVSLIPRSYLDVAGPPSVPGPDGPAIASKTGSVGGCRADTGLLYLPDDGGTIAYCAAADQLADKTMTSLAEGNEILGRLGAILLARWWPGPGPVPVRPGWIPVS